MNNEDGIGIKRKYINDDIDKGKNNEESIKLNEISENAEKEYIKEEESNFIKEKENDSDNNNNDNNNNYNDEEGYNIIKKEKYVNYYEDDNFKGKEKFINLSNSLKNINYINYINDNDNLFIEHINNFVLDKEDEKDKEDIDEINYKDDDDNYYDNISNNFIGKKRK